LAPGEAIYVNADAPTELTIPGPSERICYYHQDHLGSSSAITDAAGELAEETANYPFGVPRNEYRPRAVETHYSFTQKERDRESGLHYFETRFLAGPLSRFVVVDPKYANPDGLSADDLTSFLAQPQNLNTYGYVRGNPIRWVDPKGLAPGDPYLSQDEAATDALLAANPRSISENREYGGQIFYDSTVKRYYATEPHTSGEAESVDIEGSGTPKGTSIVGDYHTHAAYSMGVKVKTGKVDGDGKPLMETISVPVPFKYLDTFYSDQFSGQDRNLLSIRQRGEGKPGDNFYVKPTPFYTGYLGTPSGKFKKLDPFSGDESELSTRAPKPAPAGQ
jgi:RHS repeat-associated protein